MLAYRGGCAPFPWKAGDRERELRTAGVAAEAEVARLEAERRGLCDHAAALERESAASAARQAALVAQVDNLEGSVAVHRQTVRGPPLPLIRAVGH